MQHFTGKGKHLRAGNKKQMVASDQHTSCYATGGTRPCWLAHMTASSARACDEATPSPRSCRMLSTASAIAAECTAAEGSLHSGRQEAEA